MRIHCVCIQYKMCVCVDKQKTKLCNDNIYPKPALPLF